MSGPSTRELDLTETTKSDLYRLSRDYDTRSSQGSYELTSLPILTKDGSTVRRWERYQGGWRLITGRDDNPYDNENAVDDERPVPITYPPPYISRTSEIPIETTDDATPMQKAYHTKQTWIYFGTCVWAIFIQGWNDASTVPNPRIQFSNLLNPPFFLGSAASPHAESLQCKPPLTLRSLSNEQKRTQVGFVVVSLLFVFNCVVSRHHSVYLDECSQNIGIRQWGSDERVAE